MTDRRSFVAWLGSLPLVGRHRPQRAAPPIVIDATPTALYQQPDGRNNLVRVAVTGLDAPAARARVTDRPESRRRALGAPVTGARSRLPNRRRGGKTARRAPARAAGSAAALDLVLDRLEPHRRRPHRAARRVPRSAPPEPGCGAGPAAGASRVPLDGGVRAAADLVRREPARRRR